MTMVPQNAARRPPRKPQASTSCTSSGKMGNNLAAKPVERSMYDI